MLDLCIHAYGRMLEADVNNIFWISFTMEDVMRLFKGTKVFLLGTILLSLFAISMSSFAMTDDSINAVVTSQILDKARKNTNWKLAFLTGKAAQIVFMNIAPSTNPKNEIGMETHKFDQVIFIAEGSGKAILNGKETQVKSGDMIFIPQGTPHNVINLNGDKPLKILSIYSSTDIPANAIYKRISDTPKEE